MQGSDISTEIPTDVEDAYILNESAVKMIGWEFPVGKQFKIVNKGTVLGVVKDFHFKPLFQSLTPMAIIVYPGLYEHFLVRISNKQIPETIQFLKLKWQQLFTEYPFEYSFFDEDFDRIYITEIRVEKIFRYVTVLALFVACFGLLGLIASTTEQRTKEIGIRKVLGASVSQIMVMLTGELIKWVLVANFIAWPIAYYAMNKWLQNFAYRIDISWWTFLLAGALALVVALLTVSFQAIRAATANPVESLRYE